jgi:hypothetical protein
VARAEWGRKGSILCSLFGVRPYVGELADSSDKSPPNGGQLVCLENQEAEEGLSSQSIHVGGKATESKSDCREGNQVLEIDIGLENIMEDPIHVQETRPRSFDDGGPSSAPIGPVLYGPVLGNASMPTVSPIKEREVPLTVPKRNNGLKKPKKGALTKGAARCVNMKDIVTKGEKHCSKGGEEDGKHSKQNGKATMRMCEVPIEDCSISTGSGVNVLFEEDGSVVPETPIPLMGDLRRKKAEA